MLSYNQKLTLFRFVRKIFKFFNLKIFYSREQNYLKGLKIDTIIDVGVAKGTKELLNNFPSSYFHLIEPNPKFWDYISENILTKFNGKLYKTAAGNKSGSFDFFDFDVASSFLQRSDYALENKINVNLDKLDNILNEIKLENALLKIDTEGYELEVLKGANDILKKVDYCIIEVRLQNIDTYNSSELINYLYERNFKIHKILKVYYVKDGIDFMDILFKK